MPRPLRAIYSNYCYHVLNRANRRAKVFHESADYAECVNKQTPFGDPIWIDEMSRSEGGSAPNTDLGPIPKILTRA